MTLQWKNNPWLVHHVLRASRFIPQESVDISEVQYVLLRLKEQLDRDVDQQSELNRFKERLFIADPKRFKAYLDDEARRKLEEEEGDIEYLAPKSNEEALELEKEFAKLAQRHETLMKESPKPDASLDFTQFVDEMRE